jgi:hypothetical protein
VIVISDKEFAEIIVISDQEFAEIIPAERQSYRFLVSNRAGTRGPMGDGVKAAGNTVISDKEFAEIIVFSDKEFAEITCSAPNVPESGRDDGVAPTH